MSIWKNLFLKSNNVEDEVNTMTKDAIEELRLEKVSSQAMDNFEQFDSRELKHVTNPFEKSLLSIIHHVNYMEEEYKNAEGIYSHNGVSLYTSLYYKSRVPVYIQECYNDVERYVNRNRFYSIYNFAQFLITADALLMYNNDDTESIYSIAESTDVIKLILIYDDYNIGYQFTKDLTKNKSQNILEQYVDGNNQEDYILGYVEVKRNNGSKTKTSFNFTMDGTIDINGIKDDILFNTIINNTIKMIVSTYDRIINKSIPTYYGGYKGTVPFTLKEYLFPRVPKTL